MILFSWTFLRVYSDYFHFFYNSISEQQTYHQKIINKNSSPSSYRMKRTNLTHKQQSQRPLFLNNRNERGRHRQTQKTIQELKQSIGSIERMIEKSQQILRNTKKLNIREVRSDSIELKLKNDSREKSNKKYQNIANPELEKDQISTILRNKTNLNTTLYTDQNTESKQYILNMPHKTKPNRPYLFIDTQDINASDEERTNRSPIFLNHAVSPISAISIGKQGIEESFADSLESPFQFGRRLRTQIFNDSYQKSTIGESLEKYSRIDSNYHTLGNQQLPTKKIILRKKKGDNIPVLHYRNVYELEQKPRTPKRKCIFQQSNMKKIPQQGKFSYYQSARQPFHHNNKPDIPQRLENQQYSNSNRLLNQNKKHSKFNKQNENLDLQAFCRKVKQFGFVQRYLTQNQIINIYEFLKKSFIPEHKWPLYVVDKVYEKMNTTAKNKV